MKKIFLAMMIGVLCCTSCGPETDGGEDDGITKEEAQQLGGKDDAGADFCELNGWYNDGVCDTFCPDPDKDCLQACADDAECGTNEACISGVCESLQSSDCGGFTGLTCAADQVCIYDRDDICGAADALGTCTTVADACAAVFAPVCGCDGQTYGNECSANLAGTSVASDGECAETCVDDSECSAGELCVDGACEVETSTSCGGFQGLQCASGEACIYDPADMCGAADQLGTCTPIPDACDQQYDPVCSCDGQTYGNACTALMAGASVAAAGECGGQVCVDDSACGESQVCTDGTCEPIKRCGGIAGLVCDATEFCDYEQGDFCGAADALGSCRLKPEACAQVFEPVCGCDNQTYSNECVANAAGISAAASGECQ